MKAMAVYTPAAIETEPLRAIELPAPEPGPREILVRIKTCGVCRTDLHIVEGDLPPRHPRIVPGHEIVGAVARCGPGCTRFAPRARVSPATTTTVAMPSSWSCAKILPMRCPTRSATKRPRRSCARG